MRSYSMLIGQARDSFERKTGQGGLVRKTWEEILSGAKIAHEDFTKFSDESSGTGGSE